MLLEESRERNPTIFVCIQINMFLQTKLYNIFICCHFIYAAMLRVDILLYTQVTMWNIYFMQFRFQLVISVETNKSSKCLFSFPHLSTTGIRAEDGAEASLSRCVPGESTDRQRQIAGGREQAVIAKAQTNSQETRFSQLEELVITCGIMSHPESS